MAITSSAGDGIRITTAAKNGTLGSQAAAASNQIIFDTAITTNNGNLTAGPTFVGRKVIVRQGLGTEETRYITAIAGDNVTATVNEAWVIQPATSDTYHVSYILPDPATLTGVTLNTKTGLYEFSRNLTVGNATPTGFAYFSITGYFGMEMDDSGSADDFTVAGDGRVDIGYLQGGEPISGGVISNTKNTAGEPYMNFVSGSDVRFYSPILWSQVTDTKITMVNGNSVDIRNATFIKNAYTATFRDATLSNITWQGTGNANDTINIDADTSIDTFLMANTVGWTSDNDAATESLEVRNCTFVGNSPNVTVYQNKTWSFVNPKLWEGTSTQVSFISSTGTNVFWKNSLGVTLTKADGSAIVDGYIYIYEGTTTQSLPTANRGITDTNGEFSSDVVRALYTFPGSVFTTTSYGDYAIKAYKYTYRPFVSSITFPDEGLVTGITLPVDTAITETDHATALSSGSGIAVTNETTNIVRVFGYDNNDAGANVKFSVGETMTGTSSGVSGTVYEISGDATSGTIIVHVTGAVNFTENEEVTGTSGGRATIDQASVNDTFAWLVDCNTSNMTVVYDYLAAEMADNPISSTFENVHIWGEDEQSQLLYLGANGYYSERNVNLTEGVYHADRGSGSIAYFTADNGYQFVPPVSYTFSLTGLQSNSEVRIYNTTNGLELAGSDSTGTTFNYSYVYSTNISIYVVIFHLSYKDIRLTGLTISNSNQTIPIQQQVDRVYSNP